MGPMNVLTDFQSFSFGQHCLILVESKKISCLKDYSGGHVQNIQRSSPEILCPPETHSRCSLEYSRRERSQLENAIGDVLPKKSVRDLGFLQRKFVPEHSQM